LPHEPQFDGSLAVLTQVDPHSICVVPQPQVPPEQLLPLGHTLPHAPQFDGSLPVSTHVEPHSRLPLGHAQTPATHDSPDGQT
jgi:hypothetical protein